MTCPSCSKSTKGIVIGTGLFCGECGERLEAQSERAATPKRSLDMRPTRKAEAAPAHTPKPTKTPAAAATQLHRRARPTSRVLDLRPARPTAKKQPQPAAAPVSMKPHPATKTTAPKPKTTAAVQHLSALDERLEQAKKVGKSEVISRFQGISELKTPAKAAHKAEPAVSAAISHHPEPQLPPAAATHHEALSGLIEQWSRHEEHPDAHKTASLVPRHARVAATVGIFAIMGSYIWLQNYPKLAISAAGNKAGITASLPRYVPSSYKLGTTATAPGLVTLSFASPSHDQPLKISQQRTAWDSKSLLDNYVAKNTSDYSAVPGQGLTVYFFDQNQAAWVNHGIWYSITGATQLSREQILKIAYSL